MDKYPAQYVTVLSPERRTMDASPPLRALLYARVSSPGQKRRVHSDKDEPSLGAQFAAMEREVHRRGWQIVGRYEDVLSGGLPVRDRPGGSQVYADAEAGTFDLLMVYDNDRIGRDQDGVVAKVFRADLRSQRKQIYSVYQPLEPKPAAEYDPYADDAALWLESVTDASSAVAIRQLRRRFAFGMRKRIEDKRLMTGKPPIGYTADRHVLPNGKVVLGKRTPDPVYAPIIRRIFTEYESGMGWRTLAKRLNEEGLRTPSGKLWTIITLRGILDNPVYYGAAVYFKSRCNGRRDPNRPNRRLQRMQPMETWLITENAQHEALISKKQWEHCQEIKRRKRNQGRTYGQSSVLSGLVRCGKCQGAMYKSGNWKGGDYLCSRHWRTGGVDCERNAIRRLVLEERVIHYLHDIGQQPAKLKGLLLIPRESSTPEVEATKESLTEQIRSLEVKMTKVREAYLAGIDSLFDYSTAKRDLEERVSALRRQMTAIEEGEAFTKTHEQTHASLSDLLSRFREQFPRKPLFLQKLLLREILERVEVTDGEVYVVFRADLASADGYERVLTSIQAYLEAPTEPSVPDDPPSSEDLPRSPSEQ